MFREAGVFIRVDSEMHWLISTTPSTVIQGLLNSYQLIQHDKSIADNLDTL